MTIGIYRLCFEGTDRCYIGQSVNIEKRFNQHINTLKNKTATKKLLDAYIKYGFPKLDILVECSSDELDSFEEEAINIFNSIENGFNIYRYANEAPVLKGVESGNSKFSRDQLIQVYHYLANTTISTKQIKEITKVSIGIINNVSRGVQHTWLLEEFPEMWLKIQNNKSIRAANDRVNKAEYQKINRSAKAQGIVYPTILSPEGVPYIVDCVQEFARINSISKSSLHRILTKQVKSCKGWRLEKYV